LDAGEAEMVKSVMAWVSGAEVLPPKIGIGGDEDGRERVESRGEGVGRELRAAGRKCGGSERRGAAVEVDVTVPDKVPPTEEETWAVRSDGFTDGRRIRAGSECC